MSLSLENNISKNNSIMKEITTEVVNTFLNGHDPMEHIISIECAYDEKKVNIIYVNDKGEKRIKQDDFKPFIWVKHSAAIRMFNGNRAELRKQLRYYGIKVKRLITENSDGTEHERLESGYKYLFYATVPMSNQTFQGFFSKAGTPIHPKQKKDESLNSSNREFMGVTPIEQYMIATGRRLFKGYDAYNQLNRFIFDLETQGLNPKIHRINQIGIRTNKGYEKIIEVEGNTKEELDRSEINAIKEFLEILARLKPDTVVGHNSENFDWNFFIVRCEHYGIDFSQLSLEYFRYAIYKKKKQSVLKLGGEVEYYYPTIMWGHNVLDSLHAARRAQAIDSNMKNSNLKYVTKYLKLKKQNRVYVPGDKIRTTWEDKEKRYGLCEDDGDWYRVTEKKPLLENYNLVSGRYIVERYLLDDLWETDKVEDKLNESNFLVGKMLPTNFSRACTMGTAGIWKLIMLAWCYENDLAVPAASPNRRFTGGLSRLLKTGYVDRIVKLDYNSLYPSVILTWHISTPIDVMNVMLSFLEYILTEREKYKGLKGEAGDKLDQFKNLLKICEDEDERKKLEKEIRYWDAEKSGNDKKQLPLKILANSFFGGYGSPNVFPFGDIIAAEKTTCISRMALRLMISHFRSIGYEPIVGDTDGFNFQMPREENFRYTKDNPYISNGRGRNSVKGKAYTRVEADVAEFEDIYLAEAYNGGVNKMGLGIDEYCDACIQFARKNYADLMPDGKTKKVGNTIKSRKMSGYLEKFIDEGVDLLLRNNGYKFLSNYYDYIEKIYNYQIPIKDIASKGNIKKTLKEYQDDCKTLTKAGSKKSRQAWYELALNEELEVNVGDTVFYINTGTKKGHSDVKRVTHYYYYNDGEKVEITKELEKLYKEYTKEFKANGWKDKKTRLDLAKEKYGTKAFDEDEIILNCKLVPNEILDMEEDVLCSDYEGLEYNVEKYIDQFNNRIRPLLVCFHPDIRNKILVTNPKDKQYFTEEESKLVSGYPNKEGDQDTYEQLMTPEKKEIEYWVKINEVPPFVKECGIDWDALVEQYKKEKEEENYALFQEENKKYLEALEEITNDEVVEFEEEGILPKSIENLMTLNSADMRLHFKKIPDKTPSTGGFVFDDIQYNYAETVDVLADF
jgi:DNA polymerase elongation subunit (family B)